MSKKLWAIFIALLIFLTGVTQVERLTYMPLVYNGAIPTITPTPLGTFTPNFPYNWIEIGRAGIILNDDEEKETIIFGQSPSICHELYAYKVDKIIYVEAINYWGESKTLCEDKLDKDYSHIPDSKFPLKECTGKESVDITLNPCVCKEFSPDNIACGDTFKILYDSASYKVCNILGECYITER